MDVSLDLPKRSEFCSTGEWEGNVPVLTDGVRGWGRPEGDWGGWRCGRRGDGGGEGWERDGRGGEWLGAGRRGGAAGGRVGGRPGGGQETGPGGGSPVPWGQVETMMQTIYCVPEHSFMAVTPANGPPISARRKLCDPPALLFHAWEPQFLANLRALAFPAPQMKSSMHVVRMTRPLSRSRLSPPVIKVVGQQPSCSRVSNVGARLM